MKLSYIALGIHDWITKLFSSRVKMYIHYHLLLFYIFKKMLCRHIRCLRVTVFNYNPIKGTQKSTPHSEKMA